METIAPVSTRIRPLMWLFVGMAVFGAMTTAIDLATGGNSTSPSSRALSYSLIFLLLGSLGAGYFRLWLTNFRLLVGTDRFGYQDALGRSHVWYASQVGEIVDVAVIYNKSSAPRRAIYFLGLDGKTLWTIVANPWSDTALDRLIRAAGKPVNVVGAPISLAEFKQRFPQATSWVGRHTLLLGVGVGLGMLALAIGIPIATIWIHR